MTKKPKKVLFIVLTVLFSLMIIGAIVYLVFYESSNNDSKEIFDELRNIYNVTIDDVPINDIVDESSVDDISDSTSEDNTINDDTTNTQYYWTPPNLQALLDQNKYFVGWITIKGTYIDYPVMQTKFDEEYYLHTSFYNYYSFAGVPFCSKRSDLETPSDNIVIYGHNMLNGTMFADLMKYSDKSFYENHKYINFDTIYHQDNVYEVVSVFRSDVSKESYGFYNFANGSQESFDRFAKFIKENSIYSIPTDIEYGDKLLTLITCTKYFGNDDGRFIVVAKQINDSNLR